MQGTEGYQAHRKARGIIKDREVTEGEIVPGGHTRQTCHRLVLRKFFERILNTPSTLGPQLKVEEPFVHLRGGCYGNPLSSSRHGPLARISGFQSEGPSSILGGGTKGRLAVGSSCQPYQPPLPGNEATVAGQIPNLTTMGFDSSRSRSKRTHYSAILYLQ